MSRSLVTTQVSLRQRGLYQRVWGLAPVKVGTVRRQVNQVGEAPAPQQGVHAFELLYGPVYDIAFLLRPGAGFVRHWPLRDGGDAQDHVGHEFLQRKDGLGGAKERWELRKSSIKIIVDQHRHVHARRSKFVAHYGPIMFPTPQALTPALPPDQPAGAARTAKMSSVETYDPAVGHRISNEQHLILGAMPVAQRAEPKGLRPDIGAPRIVARSDSDAGGTRSRHASRR